jgi:hypothetical protein
VANIFVRFENFLEKAVLPWLENFTGTVVHNEVAALAPIFEKAVTDTLPLIAAATKPTDLGSALASVFGSALTEAEQKGLQVGAISIVQALGGALANAQASATATPTTPATEPSGS